MRKAFRNGDLENLPNLLKNNRGRWISVLLTLLDDPDAQVKINVLSFIPHTKERIKAVPKLIYLLNDPNWRVRFFASQALGQIRDKRATKGLTQAWLKETLEGTWQENENPQAVQQEIAIALAKIGDKEAVPVLLKTYKNGDKEVQLLSAMVLYKLLDDDSYFNVIAKAVHSEEYKRERGRIIWILGELGDQKIVPLLEEVLDDEDPKIRRIVQKSLEKIKRE